IERIQDRPDGQAEKADEPGHEEHVAGGVVGPRPRPDRAGGGAPAGGGTLCKTRRHRGQLAARARMACASSTKYRPASSGDRAPKATSWAITRSSETSISPAALGGEGGSGPSKSPRLATKLSAI